MKKKVSWVTEDTDTYIAPVSLGFHLVPLGLFVNDNQFVPNYRNIFCKKLVRTKKTKWY